MTIGKDSCWSIIPYGSPSASEILSSTSVKTNWLAFSVISSREKTDRGLFYWPYQIRELRCPN